MILRSARIVLFLAAAVLAQRVPAGRADPPAPKVPEAEDSLAVIVNHANPTNDISLSELRAIFLGERTHWPNGRRITLVMMEPGQPERDVVLREVCRMNESDFRRRFLQGLLTGEVLVSPKTLATPVGVRKFVFNVPGAIGYIRPSDVDPSVKVLRIDGRLPRDGEYTLRISERGQR